MWNYFKNGELYVAEYNDYIIINKMNILKLVFGW